MTKSALIGAGSESNGDDAAGLHIIRALKKIAPRGMDVIEAGAEGAAIMETWENYSDVIVFDAVLSGAPAGTIIRLDARAGPLPAIFSRGSTHSFGLAEAVELARSLDALPQSLVIYGIEGKSFERGTDLSREVEAAVDVVVKLMAKDVFGSGA